MKPIPVVIAAFDEMQAMVTVCAGVLLEKLWGRFLEYFGFYKNFMIYPAARAASRAIFEVFTSWMTLENY
jgi:hypothetical protein